MRDLIERQAEIDATLEEPTYTDAMNVLTEVRDRIKALSSAQPEIIRCEDCEFGRLDVFERGMWCTRHPEYDIGENDFCSRAKRRREQDG